LQGRSIEKPSAIHGRGVEQQNESLEHFDFGVTSDCTSLGLNGTSEWQTSFDDVVDSGFDMAGLTNISTLVLMSTYQTISRISLQQQTRLFYRKFFRLSLDISC